MIHDLSYCFSPIELFDTFNTKQLKIRKDVVQKKYGLNKKQRICASVLIYCFYLILLDIIENNVTFVLPLFNGKRASIYARPIVGEDFKRARQHGAFKDIDVIASNFTGYQITYSWQSKDGSYTYKPCYISKAFKDAFIDNINKGKQYF